MVIIQFPLCNRCLADSVDCHACCTLVMTDLEYRDGSTMYPRRENNLPAFSHNFAYVHMKLSLDEVQAIIALWRIKIPMLCKVPIEIEEKEDG